MNGVVIGRTGSRVGKTVVTLAAIRVLEEAGYAVQPVKASPEFIDPSRQKRVAL